MAAIESLELHKQFNRAQYEAEFGEQPPPHTNERPDKLWFDKSDTAGNYMRVSRDETGKPSLVPMTMSRELAASMNITGAYRWPQYTPAPTQAAAQFKDENGRIVATVPVQAADLTMEDEARAIALEVGGVFARDMSWAASSVEWPADEQRRIYLVHCDVSPYNAGQLLRRKYVNGIGAPGRWVKDASGLRWEPAAQSTAQLDPKVKPVPVPCRQLAADEEFRLGFGGIWTVEKKSPASEQIEILRLLKLLLSTFRIAF